MLDSHQAKAPAFPVLQRLDLAGNRRILPHALKDFLAYGHSSGSFVEHPFDKGVWKQALAVIRNIRIEHPV